VSGIHLVCGARCETVHGRWIDCSSCGSQSLKSSYAILKKTYNSQQLVEGQVKARAYLEDRCLRFPGSRQATLNLEQELQGPGSPEHRILRLRHLSQATVTEFLRTAEGRV
jgi:hypothetical protein